jgi:hypothetical protein
VRYFGLVHVAVCADCLGGHGAKLAESDKHAPFRHPDLVTLGVCVRNNAGADIQTVGQELIQLKCHLVDGSVWHPLSRFVGHFVAGAILRTGESGGLSAQLRLPKIFAEVELACNDSKLGPGRSMPAGPESERRQPSGQGPRLGACKTYDEDGSGELAEDHDFHVKVLARFPSEWHNALPAKLFQEMWFQTQLTAA